jgi:hypothetical protein
MPTPMPTPWDDFEFQNSSSSVLVMIIMIMAWCCFVSLLILSIYAACTFACICFRDFFTSCREGVCLPYVLGRLRPDGSLRPGHKLASTIAAVRHASTMHGTTDRDDTCTVCLVRMEPNDLVKELACSHCFHKECLDSWLAVSTVCPMCRQEVQATNNPNAEEKRWCRCSCRKRSAEEAVVAESVEASRTEAGLQMRPDAYRN